MCCENFWKKITVFSLTLLIGFFATKFFKVKEPINTKIPVLAMKNLDDLSLQKSSPTVPKSIIKDCIPADQNLKFRNLPFNASEEEIFKTEFNRLFLHNKIEILKNNKEELKKNNSKESKDFQTKLKQIEEEIESLEKLLKKAEVDPQVYNLLYLEKCSDL